MNEEIINLLLTGYMKREFNIFTPNIVIYVLSLYYTDGNIIPCNVFDMKLTKLGNNIVRMYINNSGFYYLSSNNELFVNGTGGANLGCSIDTKGSNVKPAIAHPIFNGTKRVSIISHGLYNKHTFVYTVNNELYGWGTNEYKQINPKFSAAPINNPRLIKCDFRSSLIQIECGHNYSLFLTLKGSVYGCGNNMLGQLTYNYSGNYSYPSKGMHAGIQSIKLLSNIKQIACGYQSSYCVDKSNTLRVFGDNSDGALGLGRYMDMAQIDHIRIVNGIKVASIKAGFSHACCLTVNQDAYTFGYNTKGQCGIKEIESEAVYGPHKISLNKKINDIKCGSSHTFVKTINNNFYGFGNNEAGQLLIDKKISKTNIPVLINNDALYTKLGSTKTIIDLIPGWYQTFVLQKC